MFRFKMFVHASSYPLIIKEIKGKQKEQKIHLISKQTDQRTPTGLLFWNIQNKRIK